MFRSAFITAALGALLAGTQTAPAETGSAKQFIRIQRDGAKSPVSLDTSIVRYSSPDPQRGLVVDLIGAVHVGEKKYYAALNEAFREYDAVLYELVAPEDANVPTPGQRSGHPISLLQVTMKSLLNLEFQLDHVDYEQKNFVHADLSPEEFAQSMEKRGESFSKLLFRMMGQGMAQQSTDPSRATEFAMLSAFFSKNRSQDLKRVLAQQFEEVEKANAVLDGPEGSTIITERNLRAMKVLQDQIGAGKQKIAIFYGAAHLPDFDKRLRADLKLQPVSERWLEAWNLREPGVPSKKSAKN